MRRLSFLLLFIPALSFSQLHIDMGIGYDISTSKPLATISLGVDAGPLVFDAFMMPSLTRAAAVNNYFGVKAGLKIHNVTPAIGFYNNHRSADDVTLNGNYAGYSINVLQPVGEAGSYIFINGLYCHKGFQLTTGLHYSF